MIGLTERAALALDEMLLANDPPPGQGIKLVATGQQIGLTWAEVEPGDQLVRRGDETLLVIDADIARAVSDMPVAIDCEISVVDGHAITEFRFVAPA